MERETKKNKKKVQNRKIFTRFSSPSSSFSKKTISLSFVSSFFTPFATRVETRKKKERFATIVTFSLPYSSSLLHFSLSDPSRNDPSKRKTQGSKRKRWGMERRGEERRKGSERKRDEAKAHGTSVSALDERRRDVERRGAA